MEKGEQHRGALLCDVPGVDEEEVLVEHAALHEEGEGQQHQEPPEEGRHALGSPRLPPGAGRDAHCERVWLVSVLLLLQLLIPTAPSFPLCSPAWKVKLVST